MDLCSILNYQGSKRNLLDFIHSNVNNLISPESTVLDIFAGTCSVGYSFKRNHTIYANDSELYSYIISTALLGEYNLNKNDLFDKIDVFFNENLLKFRTVYLELKKEEEHLILKNDSHSLIAFYQDVPTIWNQNASFNLHVNYELFTTYYSASYFGVKQSMEIDSLRYAIEQFKNTTTYSMLLTSLFFAMKECVFSKDGHMAQPLNPEKNQSKLLTQRKKSIYNYFKEKVSEFFSDRFVNVSRNNKTYNLNFEDLLKLESIQNDVNFIYADPPYTDMQYSRYYHLLNIVAKYSYPLPTKNSGNYTKGLYTEDRYQSKLSSKSTCLTSFSNLVEFATTYKKSLAISFAYPKDVKNQKTDRYVMSINDLIATCSSSFGSKNVEVATSDYTHSNNRNSSPKKVIEYLILCKN